MHNLRVSIFSILLMLAATSVQAMSITWTFENAIFDDATSLTGSFDFDMDGGFWDPGAYSNVNLDTQTGVIDAQHYDSVGLFAGNLGFMATNGSFFSSVSLGVLFENVLTSAVDSIEILGGAEMATVLSWTGIETITRTLISGRIVSNGSDTGGVGPIGSGGGSPAITLPEPAILVMFAMGLVAVFFVRRRAII
jgi:hypothetical protein